MLSENPPHDDLVVHLDLEGIAALMKALEGAIATGRGRIEPGSGVTVRGGKTVFAGVTLTFYNRGGGLALAA